MRFDQFAKVVGYWTVRADAELDRDGDPPDCAPCSARLQPGVGGEVHLEADLDPVGGAQVAAALDRLATDWIVPIAMPAGRGGRVPSCSAQRSSRRLGG